MKGLKPFPPIGLAIILCALISGCASHAPQSGPGALEVSQFFLNTGAIGVPYEQVLLATGGQKPYTWTLIGGALPPGLTLQASGIISGTPTVDPNVTYPNTYNFGVKVVDSQTPTAAYNSTTTSITINAALGFASVALPSVVAGNSYLATVTATAGLPPYTYNVVFGNLPDGLTLAASGNTAGTISGVPTTAGTFNFTIQATDSASETATAAFTIVITGRLQGSYIIQLNGFYQSTPSQPYQPFYMVGEFVADGNGNVTSGVFDQSSPGGLISDTPLTAGTYTIPSGTNLGTLTLTEGPFGTRTYDMIVSTAGSTQLIMKDIGFYGSGLITKQTATSLPTAGVSYAFGAFGTDASQDRYASAGAIAVNAALAVTGGEEDTNDGGTVGSAVPITSGTMVATPLDPSTGRGTAQLTTAAGTSNYAYYVLSGTQLMAVETDSGGPSTLMTILQQGAGGTTGGGSLNNASLQGQAVMQLNALNTGLDAPDVSVGVASFDGNGNISRSDGMPGFFTDENNGGVVSQNSYSGTYNVDATCPGFSGTCGRVTVTGLGSYQPAWYLVTANQGFVVGTDPSVTSGSFQPQSVPATGFNIASLLGAYLASTSDPVTSNVTNQVDVATTPPPGGIFSVNYESSGPDGPQPEQNFFGPYNCGNTSGSKACSTQAAAFGRFVVSTNDPNNPQEVLVLYVLGSGASGTTGAKSGLVGLNFTTAFGSAQPYPSVTNYGH